MTRKLDSALRHGGYVIYYDGTEYVAEPYVPEDPIFEMASQSVDRLIAMIDELWAAINSVTSLNAIVNSPPPWFERFLSGEVDGRVNVDVFPWVYDKEKHGTENKEPVYLDFHPDDIIDHKATAKLNEIKVSPVIRPMNKAYQEYILAKYQNAGRARRQNRRLRVLSELDTKP